MNRAHTVVEKPVFGEPFGGRFSSSDRAPSSSIWAMTYFGHMTSKTLMDGILPDLAQYIRREQAGLKTTVETTRVSRTGASFQVTTYEVPAEPEAIVSIKLERNFHHTAGVYRILTIDTTPSSEHLGKSLSEVVSKYLSELHKVSNDSLEMAFGGPSLGERISGLLRKKTASRRRADATAEA